MFSKQALFFPVFATVLIFAVITASLITFILPETFASKALVKFDQKNLGETFRASPEAVVFQSERFQELLIDKLLARNWSRRPDETTPLSRADFSKLVERSFRTKALHDATSVEIEAFGTTPEQAADLANTITETYQLYRLEMAKELRAETIRAFEKSLRDVQQKIEAGRKKLSELDPEKTERQLEYSDAKRRLEELERFSEILNQKLEEAPAEESSSPAPEHFIVKSAVPNLRPVRPNKPLNLGLGLILGTTAGALAGIGAVAVRKPKR